MKLNRIQPDVNNLFEGLWTVEEINPEDIPTPSNHFFHVVRGLSGFSFINSLTKDEFTRRVRERFSSESPA